MYVAKIKAPLISFAVTANLICVFVFAYAKKPVFLRCGSIKTISTSQQTCDFVSNFKQAVPMSTHNLR